MKIIQVAFNLKKLKCPTVVDHEMSGASHMLLKFAAEGRQTCEHIMVGLRARRFTAKE
jgi:hypothetical protein